MSEHEELPGALELARGIAEGRWPHTMDARAWVDEWMRLTDPSAIARDEGAMLGWFANAIMAGYDTGRMHEARAAAPAAPVIATKKETP